MSYQTNKFPPVKNFYSSGTPYVKSIDFSTVTAWSGNVVVGAVTYTYGTDFGDASTIKEPVGRKPNVVNIANSFAEAVNGVPGLLSAILNPNALAYARCFGTKVYLYGRVAANDFTLTSTLTGETIATESVGSYSTIPVSISSTSVGSTWTSASGTITSGGASQVLVAASATRKGFLFQNVSDTDMWLGIGATAVANQPSIKVAAGASISLTDQDAPVTAVNVFCATTGKAFTCFTR